MFTTPGWGQLAELWAPLSGQRVLCQLCFHACTLAPGEMGFCGVRGNAGGKLVTLVGDSVVSMNLDPVEKKPLYHFLPGSSTLSLGTYGCNFACRFCQNSGISRAPADSGRIGRGTPVSPSAVVAFARDRKIRSISFTYNEPTVFYELLAGIADLATDVAIRTVMVTNGCMSKKAIRALAPRITAANVDLKAFREDTYREICSGSLAQVLSNLVSMKEAGWWVEVTTLVVPGMNDTEQELRGIARFIARELGEDTPWHVSAFFPCYQMADRPPTPARSVIRAWEIGREAGLRYPYTGNLVHAEGAVTYCPSCGEKILERQGFSVLVNRGSVCPGCGTRLAGIWD